MSAQLVICSPHSLCFLGIESQAKILTFLVYPISHLSVDPYSPDSAQYHLRALYCLLSSRQTGSQTHYQLSVEVKECRLDNAPLSLPLLILLIYTVVSYCQCRLHDNAKLLLPILLLYSRGSRPVSSGYIFQTVLNI